MSEIDARLIRLAEPDNVLMIATALNRGERLFIGDQEIILESDLALGHKIAARDIAAGETILKYNFPIGTATENIPSGAHVHVHNVTSNYTPTYIIPEEETC